MITIQIPGKPVAKKRPKFFRRGSFVGAYNPQESEEGKWLWYARQQIPCKLSGPVSIKMQFGMEIPKSVSAKRRAALIGKPHVKKPDLDNMVKFALDCLNGVAWGDDSSISQLIAVKLYMAEPETFIFIEGDEQ